MDVHEPAVRSYNMSRVKSKNTKPELVVRRFLHSQGFRYRLNDKTLPGKPDLVLPKFKTVVFIHGCFWHGHKNCKYATIPKTRTEWWANKIETNKKNDRKAIRRLKKDNWKVLTIWTCKLKGTHLLDTLESLLNKLH